MPAAKSIAGSPEQMLDTIGEWAAIGVDHILLDPVAPGGIAGRRAAMERFMVDVAPAGHLNQTAAMPSLLERDAELAVLGTRLVGAIDGHGRVVFVAGEAGVGKTELTGAFLGVGKRRRRDHRGRPLRPLGARRARSVRSWTSRRRSASVAPSDATTCSACWSPRSAWAGRPSS